MPSAIPQETVRQILTDYSQQYRPEDDSSAWFERIKAMCPAYGFASEMKQYRQNPQDYAGHVGDLSMVLRVAVCGRSQAPDLYTVMQLLGQDTVRERLARAAQTISA